MATEVVLMKVVKSFTPKHCEDSLKHFNPPPPGLIKPIIWGRNVDDPFVIYWIQNWDSVEAHENFAKSEKFPPFLASVKLYLAENPIIYHALLRPFPPVKLSESPFIEIRSFESQDVVQQARMATTISNHLESQCHFLGIKHEDPDVQIALIGWQSKHLAQEFAAPLAGLKEVEVSSIIIEVQPYLP